jgi:hypothetical protein
MDVLLRAPPAGVCEVCVGYVCVRGRPGVCWWQQQPWDSPPYLYVLAHVP